MKKIRIKTPATSANIGPGFDFLGMAFDLFNVFEFEESDHFEEVGFGDVDENMVLNTYKALFKRCDLKPVPVKIKMVKNDIPVSRGLGSSASAIVAGMMAADYFMDYQLSEEELIDEMVKYEGHPDNVMACYLGGLVSSVQDDKLYSFKHKVNKDLLFTLAIPNYKVSTAKARAILPGSLTYHDVTANASRAMMLNKGFEDGDIDLLKVLLKDEIHEKYRSTLIPDYQKIKEVIKDEDCTLNISGSGSTMLLISKKEIKDKLNFIDVKQVKINRQGATLKEL